MNMDNSDPLGIKEMIETRSISKESIGVKRRYVPKKSSGQIKNRRQKTKRIKKEKKILLPTEY